MACSLAIHKQWLRGKWAIGGDRLSVERCTRLGSAVFGRRALSMEVEPSLTALSVLHWGETNCPNWPPPTHSLAGLSDSEMWCVCVCVCVCERLFMCVCVCACVVHACVWEMWDGQREKKKKKGMHSLILPHSFLIIPILQPCAFSLSISLLVFFLLNIEASQLFPLRCPAHPHTPPPPPQQVIPTCHPQWPAANNSRLGEEGTLTAVALGTINGDSR